MHNSRGIRVLRAVVPGLFVLVLARTLLVFVHNCRRSLQLRNLRSGSAYLSRMASLEAIPLCSWMEHLPEEAQQRNLCQLALPSAHNAGARAVTYMPHRTLTQFVGKGIACLPGMSYAALAFARSITICQCLSIGELLTAGVRVLDLRAGLHEGQIYICHGLICDVTLKEALEQVADFLRRQSEEIVVVLIKPDWFLKEDFGPLEAENWQMLLAEVAETLGEFYIAGPSFGNDCPLTLSVQKLRQRGQRAVVLVRAHYEVPLPEGLVRMCPETYVTTWQPSTSTVEEMISVLESHRASGWLRPSNGQLKVLEVALPRRPSELAPLAMEAFRCWVAEEVLCGAVNLDFPDEITVRFIVQRNWEGLLDRT